MNKIESIVFDVLLSKKLKVELLQFVLLLW